MGVVKDQPMHVVSLECDGRPTCLGCLVAEEVLGPTRDECNEHLFYLGWRLHGERTLCRCCSKREMEARAALDEKGEPKG